MENSVLSDAAGVQKNISKMYEDYAKQIGKTTDSLTQAEKAQAVYNGIMDEASMFTGSATEMAQGYQGVQAQANAANLELSRTIGESMIPALTQYNSLQLSITKGLTEFISNHKGVTSGIITFTTTLLAATVAMIALKKAKDAYTTSAFAATAATKGFTAALMSNPIFIIATTLATVISGITMLCSAIKENEEAQAKLNETTERYKQIKDGVYKYEDEDKTKLQEENEIIKSQIEIMTELADKQKELNEIKERSKDTSGTSPTGYWYSDEDLKKVDNLNAGIKKLSKSFKELQKSNRNYGNSLKELKANLKTTEKGLSDISSIEKIKAAIDTDTIKKQQQEAAQLKVNAKTMQDYLNIIKKGNTNTTEYQNAVKELAKAYPEASNAQGIIIDKAQDYINAEKAKADQAWNTSQSTIKGSIEVINTFIEMARQAENDAVKQQELANSIGISYSSIIPTLTSVLNILNAMANMAPAAVGGVTPVSVSAPKLSSSGGSSKSYSNKALDNYKKQIEHKKALDQISLQQEIEMYQIALKRYARTQDEKWELTEKIYLLEKELREKNLDDYTAMIEHRKNLDQISIQDEINMYQYAYNALAKTTEEKEELEEKLHELRKELAQKDKELLDQQTSDYKRYIQDQKNLRGAEYDSKEQERDLNKIITMHRNYLNQIMKDERLSLDERKELYQEELDVIRDYEQQKRDLRVQSVDNTVSQLTNAITKQLEEMQEADKKAIEENIKLVEEWKNTRIDAINEEYNTRIEAIQKELDLLDKAEEEKSRAEEDAEYERKRNRLEQLIAYEHDATTKANYQKELDKLVAEYQKTLDKRILQDKKDALKEQQELLKEEQDQKIQSIEYEANKQKEAYDKKLDELEEYYNKQKDIAQETAEKMLLNVEKNQDQILKLLNSYGNAYEITGQSLGEKLAQGINNGIADKIQNIIQNIQDRIDAGIENKIKEWTSGIYKYEAGYNKPQTKTISVTQQNYIEQNPEMPSETYRKLNSVSERLATEIAGM